MSNLVLDVGLAAKLKVAFARNGWTTEMIDRACEGNSLGQYRQFLLGHTVMQKVSDCIIDCDAEPVHLDRTHVEVHQKGGNIVWNPADYQLRLISDQDYTKPTPGNELQQRTSGWPVLNANVLDYLLANQNLIPREWRFREIFFWGTIYREEYGKLIVRYLTWSSEGEWQDRSFFLIDKWHESRRAYALVSGK